MRNWAQQALNVLEDGQSCALISLLAVEGSAPRGPGTRMVVTQTDCVGTIGGGNLEFQAIRQARAVLSHAPGTWRIQDYPLGPFLGQCCGGRVRLMVEHLDKGHSGWLEAVRGQTPVMLETQLFDDHVERRIVAATAPQALTARGPQPAAGSRLIEAVGEPVTPLLMFGAGHVGQAIARVIDGLPLSLNWYDTRPECADIPHVAVAEAAVLAEAARQAAGLVLILTHDHALDYQLTGAALSGRASFVGLIGSATKRARFISRLRKDGFSDEALARLCCPIGVAGITGKAPEVIAVSVAAQLLMLKA